MWSFMVAFLRAIELDDNFIALKLITIYNFEKLGYMDSKID